MMLLALASVAVVSPAAAQSRMRRPRGERPEDAPRVRAERDSGMYGEEAGAYGAELGAYGGICDTSILEFAQTTPEISTLNAAVAAAGLAEALEDPTLSLTLLAPNNDAFAEIDADLLASLLASPEELSAILLLHGIEGVVFAGDLVDGMVVPTLSGGELTVGVSDTGVTFTSPAGVVANVVEADIEICNSVVHIIDAVLLP